MATAGRADYGLDAPHVVRNLLLAGALGLVIWGTAYFGLWSGVLSARIGGVELRFPAAGALWPGAGCTAMALWMLWSSKVGKVRDREKLLDRIPWTGEERVLDVGCGRGLMLVGAARRLTTGRATGIDIWQAEDLSGNRPEATLENARLEGVADRVEVQTADMRKIPFPDGAFDVIVSSQAIHNVYDAGGRAQAIGEIARVLAPGGRTLLRDIRHTRDYAAVLAANGVKDIRQLDSPLATAFLALVTFGSLRPGTLLARKP
ncbi:MAG TPA: class I SAM-dependent methyltransferase [Thermoanaerobaculia bacterium]|jgi:ubiquinone/menaquinone biosynthesis C-methylase UbiE